MLSANAYSIDTHVVSHMTASSSVLLGDAGGPCAFSTVLE